MIIFFNYIFSHLYKISIDNGYRLDISSDENGYQLDIYVVDNSYHLHVVIY